MSCSLLQIISSSKQVRRHFGLSIVRHVPYFAVFQYCNRGCFAPAGAVGEVSEPDCFHPLAQHTARATSCKLDETKDNEKASNGDAFAVELPHLNAAADDLVLKWKVSQCKTRATRSGPVRSP